MSLDVPKPRGPIFVFGEYFMKKYYTVFDVNEKIIGFAESNQNEPIGNYITTPYPEANSFLPIINPKSQKVAFGINHNTLSRDDYLIINP
jgi:hypothetical protein